jgi:hypothetical protein
LFDIHLHEKEVLQTEMKVQEERQEKELEEVDFASRRQRR